MKEKIIALIPFCLGIFAGFFIFYALFPEIQVEIISPILVCWGGFGFAVMEVIVRDGDDAK